ncbi:MAG: hypothetical protein ACK5U4_13460 [Rhodospirillales bacterium]
MNRITTSSRQIDKFGPGKDGFTRGDEATGVPATALNFAWFDGVQEELAAVIEGAGIALDAGSFTQLRTAIAAMIAAGTPAGVAYLASVQGWTRAQRYAPQNLTDGPTIDWNLDTQPVARVTLGGNRSLNAPSNQRDGGMFALIVNQDATGGRTLAWNVAYDFGLEGAPILPAGPNKVSIFTFMSNGAAMRCVGRWSN